MTILSERFEFLRKFIVRWILSSSGSINSILRAMGLLEGRESKGYDPDGKALYMDKGVVFDGSCVMGQILALDEPPAPRRSAEDTSPDGYKDQPTRS